MILLSAIAALLSPAHAQACEDVATLPEATQVAWISPAGRRVAGWRTVEVVRVSDLRAWIRDNSADQARLVQGLGMAPRRGGRKTRRTYKVTIFDVRADWMCRPVTGATPGSDVGGVAACDGKDAKPIYGHRAGFTGCGYTLDTAASTRGVDTFRVRWRDASSWGFCVMPLDRFISGA